MGILRWIMLSLRHSHHAWERPPVPSASSPQARPAGGTRDAAIVLATLVAAYALIGVMVALMAVL
jgi:hypothetical protein